MAKACGKKNCLKCYANGGHLRQALEMQNVPLELIEKPKISYEVEYCVCEKCGMKHFKKRKGGKT